MLFLDIQERRWTLQDPPNVYVCVGHERGVQYHAR